MNTLYKGDKDDDDDDDDDNNVIIIIIIGLISVRFSVIGVLAEEPRASYRGSW